MTLIYARATTHEAPDNWSNFKDLYPDLFDANNPILDRYYTKDTLVSDAARTGFVHPDLEALPLQAG